MEGPRDPDISWGSGVELLCLKKKPGKQSKTGASKKKTFQQIINTETQEQQTKHKTSDSRGAGNVSVPRHHALRNLDTIQTVTESSYPISSQRPNTYSMFKVIFSGQWAPTCAVSLALSLSVLGLKSLTFTSLRTDEW